MSKLNTIFKRIVKTILWAISALILLCLITLLLIQFSSVQTAITTQISTYVSKKTGTTVQLKKVNITLPNTIELEQIYFSDKQKDTLLYLGNLKIDIDINDVLNQKLNLHSVKLCDLTVHLKRSYNDSLFNYNFLITSFTDTSKSEKVKSPTEKKWQIAVQDLQIANVQFLYDDRYTNKKIACKIYNGNLKMDSIDLQNMQFDVNKLVLKRLTANVYMGKNNHYIHSNDTKNKLPIILAKLINIQNSKIQYTDSNSKINIDAQIGRFETKAGKVDLNNELVDINLIALANSDIKYLTETSETKINSSLKKEAKNSNSSQWTVKVKNIYLGNNGLLYRKDSAEINKVFNTNYLNYNKIYLKATDLYFSDNDLKLEVSSFSTIDNNQYTISNLSTNFSMNKNSIHVQNLKAKTSLSEVKSDIYLEYRSLSDIATNLGDLGIKMKINKLDISNKELVYYVPQLKNIDFFRNESFTSSLNGEIIGKVNDLKGKNIVIKTAHNSKISTNFSIKGLPNASKAYYDFPDLEVSTTKQDIKKIAGSSMPANIELPNNMHLIADFNGTVNQFVSTIGLKTSSGNLLLSGTLDAEENFSVQYKLANVDVGYIVRDKAKFGNATMTGKVIGKNLNPKYLTANIKSNIDSFDFNNYCYKDIAIDGNLAEKEFKGKVTSFDPNIAFNFDGYVNLNPSNESFKFLLDLQALNLKHLNFNQNDITLGCNINADVRGSDLSNMNGKIAISNILFEKDKKIYQLDSAVISSASIPNNHVLELKSALIDLKYFGNVSVSKIPQAFTSFLNKYYAISTKENVKNNYNAVNCKFEAQLKNHPIIKEVFLAQLLELDTTRLSGSFNNEANQLIINAQLPQLQYGSLDVNNVSLHINSDRSAINYQLNSAEINNSPIRIENLKIDGKLADNTIYTKIASKDSIGNIKIQLISALKSFNNEYKLKLNPDSFIIMNEHWQISPENNTVFNQNGFTINNLNFSNSNSYINISSTNKNNDITIGIAHLNLEKLSQIIEKDSSLIKGELGGNILLKSVNNSFGIIADAGINNLKIKNVGLGNVFLIAKNTNKKQFDVSLKLSGNENNLIASGYFIPDSLSNMLHFDADIKSLSMKTIEAFSMGQIRNSDGFICGKILVDGKSSAPNLNGELIFKNVTLNPKYLNNKLSVYHDTILLKTDGIYFNKFKVLDAKQNSASLTGAVKMNNFKNFNLALHAEAKDFMLFNTTIKDNNLFYGKMIIDTKIDINGPLTLPVLNAKVNVKNQSNICFIVPENKVSTYKGEDVVTFESDKKNEVLTDITKSTKKSSFNGFDLSSVILVDDGATLKILMDPTSSDSLVVKGDATLGFSMDKSGKMSLTGAYHVNSGSYEITLQSLLKKKFEIIQGSTITWNGDPLDATIAINASYSTRATPYDLVADQVSGLSNADKAGYKQMYPFLVILKMRGQLLQPEIGFEIQLPDDKKGILGGAVNQKLNMLNEDASELNKQVFSLLILSRFLQQDPLQTESNFTSLMVRSTVSGYLSNELNKFGSKIVPGVELNFDVESFEDYQSGSAQGRTQVDIGVKKQLFNERLTVELGSSVNVEGKSNSNDIVSDVNLEYKLTKDGRYRLKGYRHNIYEGVIDGQLVETGIGTVYVRDFDLWSDFFKKPTTESPNKNTKKN